MVSRSEEQCVDSYPSRQKSPWAAEKGAWHVIYLEKKNTYGNTVTKFGNTG